MGNTNEVKELLEGGANVNEPNDVSAKYCPGNDFYGRSSLTDGDDVIVAIMTLSYLDSTSQRRYAVTMV